jgi:hypothetical protein
MSSRDVRSLEPPDARRSVVSVAYGKGPKGKATRLHSQLVRSRGACERCGESRYEKLTTAHIIRRTFTATRTDETASWCLCYSCHRITEDFGDEFMELVRRTIGEDRYYELKARALAGMKRTQADWQAEILRLESLLREVAA